jgi:hypothetical protein
MANNPFSILLITEKINSEEFSMPRENKLARHYLKTWEKFFISKNSRYQSLNRRPSAIIQSQIKKSGAYLLDFVLSAGEARDFVFELDTQIKSELCSLCDVSEFVDGDLNERTANVLSFVFARTLFVLRDCNEEENLGAVIPASLFALSRFGEWLHESQ